MRKEEYARRTQEMLKAGSVTMPLPVLVQPCSLLGAIVEFCATCRNDEGRHVRVCEHDDNPTEKCTLVFVSDRVWSCDRCTHRPDKK